MADAVLLHGWCSGSCFVCLFVRGGSNGSTSLLEESFFLSRVLVRLCRVGAPFR